MKTAGELIKETRLQKNLSKSQLGEMTHIKTSFIDAIENSRWDSLPDISVVTGFIKSISHFLDIDDNLTVALLKREYKPTKQAKEKPQKFGKKFIWSPRLTFITGILIVIITVIGYLGIQFKKFNSPPKLIIKEPVQNQPVKTGTLTVKGSTDPDAAVEINNQPTIVESTGDFIAQIDVNQNTGVVNIIAKSRSGKETAISRTIKVIP